MLRCLITIVSHVLKSNHCVLVVAICLFQNMKIRHSWHTFFFLVAILLLLFVIALYLAVLMSLYRGATSTVTQALLCRLHCVPGKSDLFQGGICNFLSKLATPALIAFIIHKLVYFKWVI